MFLINLIISIWLPIIGISVLTLFILSAFFLLFRIGNLQTRNKDKVGNIGDKIGNIEDKIGNKIGNIEDKIEIIDDLLNKFPLILNERGEKILKDSNIEKFFTTKYYDNIVKQVKEKSPENSYQIQEYTIEVLSNFKNKEEYREELEKAAFKSGSDISTILLVAAINIRDKIINDLGFSDNE